MELTPRQIDLIKLDKSRKLLQFFTDEKRTSKYDSMILDFGMRNFNNVMGNGVRCDANSLISLYE